MSRNQYPSKQSINLVIREKTMNSPSRALPVFFVALAFIVVFSKFAVVDRLTGVMRAQAELDRMNTDITALSDKLAQYSEIEEAYVRYGTAWMTTEELELVDRPEMLALLEREVAPAAQIGSITVQGDAMAVELLGITLDGASEIVYHLEQDDMVTSVGVYTASTMDEQGNTIPKVTMTINCTNGYNVPSQGEASGS